MGKARNPSRKTWWRAALAGLAALAAFLLAGLGTGPADDPDKDLGD
jgi:hypothetical protein